MAQDSLSDEYQINLGGQRRVIVVLDLLGATMHGLEDVELDRLNPLSQSVKVKATWKDPDIYALNREILNAAGHDWHYLAPLNRGEIELLREKGYFAAAVELLRQKVDKPLIFGARDPRVAKLLWFWKEVFSHCQLDVSYLLILCHPLSVARSLAKHGEFESEKGYLVWLAHVIECLSNTDGQSRMLVTYDSLIRPPDHELHRVMEHLDAAINVAELHRRESELFNEESLCTVYDLNDLSSDDACPPLAREVYATLLGAVFDDMSLEDTTLRKKVERWRLEYERLKPALTLMDKLFTERAAASKAISDHEERIAGLTQAITKRDEQLAGHCIVAAERDALRQTVAELYASSSWRLTGPIRYVGRWVLRAKAVGRQSRYFLKRDGLPQAASKTARVLRREGLRGIKNRLLVRVLTAPPHSSSPRSAAIIRSPDGRYALAERSRGYTYVPPRRPDDLEKIIAAMKAPPRFSILVPVYNTPVELLDKLLASVQSQWYPHWQLILADDASPSVETQAALARIDDPRVIVLRSDENQGIAGATNLALARAGGDFVVFLDHDDELTVDCLYELALCIERDNPDYLYSDEDKISPEGDFVQPHFKPDWSPDTLMSTMFTCHVSCVRRSLLEELGGLRPAYDGCQDWDLVLRVAERTRRISHIPKVLYHWRIIPASIAADIGAKSYVMDASRRVREDALKRRGLQGTVEAVTQVPGYFRVNYHLRGAPLVSIVVPSRDNGEILRRCVDSIFDRSTYRNIELIVLDNGSVDPPTLRYLETLRADSKVAIVRHDAPFNFSELNNIGAAQARGELLLFLNDDTEVVTEDWLERLGGYAQLPHVGAVGAKLLYPGGRLVQHAGILNLEDGPGHAFLREAADSPGYFMRNLLEYNWLAVTGACLMVEREKFMTSGGFDETLPVAYNDIDLCLRLHASGHYNVVCQAVRLIHHESVSRGLDHASPERLARLKKDHRRLYAIHPRYFQHDPFHNPNLQSNSVYFDIPA
jgi:GT2 family glycosyltransferase